MATTAYAIRHRTTKRYLTSSPFSGRFTDSDSALHAYPYDGMGLGEAARLALGSFADCYEVVEIALPEMRTASEVHHG